MAKRTTASAQRRRVITRLNAKVESLTFELSRTKKALDMARIEHQRIEFK